MLNLESLRTMLRYNDWSDDLLLRSASSATDEQLDRPFDMGVGSLRRTLIHIYNGEHVWLNRCQGRTETKWPPESEPVTASTISERLRTTWRERDAFLASRKEADLAAEIVYRDSKGSLFKATLSDMLMQMFVHSAHHRAQAVNMVRRVGLAAPEVDYMMWLRKPA